MKGKEILKVPQVLEIGKSRKKPSKDWVVFAVVARKAGSKKTEKGSQYTSWSLTDLKESFVSFNLFEDAFLEFSGVQIGSLVAILNPNVYFSRVVFLLLGFLEPFLLYQLPSSLSLWFKILSAWKGPNCFNQYKQT